MPYNRALERQRLYSGVRIFTGIIAASSKVVTGKYIKRSKFFLGH
jgi:hypothetical protein